MKIAERIRTLADRDPFRPFKVVTEAAQVYRVTLPEQIHLLPGARWLGLMGGDDGVSFPARIELESVREVIDEAQPEKGTGKVTVEKFDELLGRRPFDPFTIFMADGTSVVVKSPEFASRTQQGRTIVVHTGGERTEYIDLLLVSRISTGVPNPRTRSSRRAG